MNLIIFGPPGAGKGTQSHYISKKYNLYQLSSGDLLRQEIKKGVADVMKDTSEAGLKKSIEIDNLKLEFPGISDEMIENILTDTNPQRIAEVKQTMREALKMQEKGMSPDEIINIQRPNRIVVKYEDEDKKDHKIKLGVQITPLDEVLKTFGESKVILRRVEFKDNKDLNNQLKNWTDNANNRIHGTTKERPFILFAEEKKFLCKLPISDFKNLMFERISIIQLLLFL